jgi:hypothetical protein
VIGLSIGLGFGLVFGLVFGLSVEQTNKLITGLGVGLVYGSVFGLEYGGIAWLRHFTLCGLLVCNHAAPWRYVRFLNGATERLFLRRIGGSYIFAHPLLLKYFADLNAKQPPS